MPGLYAPDHFDLAGTIVGTVEVDAIPDASSVTPGDAIVGLPSVGLHTNGYSLARTVIPREEWEAPFSDGTYADALLAEHPSYYAAVRAIQAVANGQGMAHITGGGLRENVAAHASRRTSKPSSSSDAGAFHRFCASWSVAVSSASRNGIESSTWGSATRSSFRLPTRRPRSAPLRTQKVIGWIEARAPDDPHVGDPSHPRRRMATSRPFDRACGRLGVAARGTRACRGGDDLRTRAAIVGSGFTTSATTRSSLLGQSGSAPPTRALALSKV